MADSNNLFSVMALSTLGDVTFPPLNTLTAGDLQRGLEVEAVPQANPRGGGGNSTPDAGMPYWGYSGPYGAPRRRA